MSLEFEDVFKKRVIYGIIDEENKKAYIGLSEDMVLTRLGQHLDKYKTVKRYIESEKPKKLLVKVLYNYTREHKNIRQLLEKKEDYFMVQYSKMGYTLINISKMKKLGLA